MHKKDYRDFLRDDLFLYWRVDPTKELDSFWEEFLVRNEDLKAPFNQAIEAFEEIRKDFEPDDLDDIALREILKTNHAHLRRRKRMNGLFSSIAAAILLLLTISTVIYLQSRPENSEAPLPTLGQVMSDDQIQLVTESGIVVIDDNSTVNFSDKKQSVETHNLLTSKEVNVSGGQQNKLIVPYGKRSNLILADGSKIQLNSGTQMEFPSHFSGESREISVVGEIYIEVANITDTPFLIHTPHSIITVHGTTFNVSSYAEDDNELVVLVNGSVEIASNNSTVALKPSEAAEIGGGKILKKKVDVSDYISWIDGYMQLTKTPLNEVLIKVGRYYNIEFQYDRDLDLSSRTCSGKLFLSDDVTDVLDMFSKMTYLEYETHNDDIIRIKQ